MNKNKIIQIISFIILVSCIAYILNSRFQYRSAKSSYDKLNRYIHTEITSEVALESESQGVDVEKREKGFLTIDYKELKEINSDFRGWISVFNNNISYPIVISSDNEKYLHTTFDGKKNFAGCIFIDYRCSSDFTDFQTVIYGHSMKDGSMFRTLVTYLTEEIAKQYPYFYIYTEAGREKYAVFSVYITNENDINFYLGNRNSNERIEYIKELQHKSIYPYKINATKINPTGEDNIISLVTCDLNNENDRIIVSGIKVK